MKQRSVLALLVIFAPLLVSAQVGRHFVSAEAWVGQARIVHVGKIVDLEQIEYSKPLTDLQKLGLAKPYRLIFEVEETIRGDKVQRLELVLSLQSAYDLINMRDHSVEIMLVGGPHRLNRFPGPEVGIEEQGKRVDGDWYHFRVLNPVKVPKSGTEEERAIASQINISYDSCRMFTNELEVVAGREQILMRARAFARLHRDMVSSVTLIVPNEFGALCGDPNAYCGIMLPICPETKKTLLILKDDPGMILRRIESRNQEYNQKRLAEEVRKALAKFPQEE